MLGAIKRITKHERWVWERTWVWVDYISIPQRSRGMQRLAINSLSAYASAAHAFVIVAPPVYHVDTGQLCNVETYNRRMWSAKGVRARAERCPPCAPAAPRRAS